VPIGVDLRIRDGGQRAVGAALTFSRGGAVGLVATWVQYGFALVLFLAGVQRIDQSLYEAASVDGAKTWHKFRYVTLPALRGEIVVAFVVSLIAALRVFDLVFVMTRGGPARWDEDLVVEGHLLPGEFVDRPLARLVGLGEVVQQASFG
jgi:hypothetical protein